MKGASGSAASQHSQRRDNRPVASEHGTGGEFVVESLRRHGVPVVFGVPGDTGVDLYDAFAQQDAVRHVLARDERHAAAMADVYARVTNTVGVIEVSSGGGVTFAVGGLGEPFAASIPILVITSDIHRGSRGTGALTEIDQEMLFAAVTKWRHVVESVEQIPEAIDAALGAAVSGRPAPVAVIIPEDVLAARAPFPDRPAARAPSVGGGLGDGVPDAAAACAVRLANAVRPVIVAGGGIHQARAWPELASVAQRLGVPIATTIHGKGAYPESAPWSLGVVGGNGARPYANDYVAQADCVLLVGTRANATDTNSFASPRRGADIHQIDIDPGRAGRNYPGSEALVGDARVVLAHLAQSVTAVPAERSQRLLDWLADRRREWQRVVNPPPTPAGPEMLWSSQVFAVVRQMFTDDEAVLVADCGTPTPYIGAHWETRRAGRTVIMARGHGPMGFALPGAVGAAVAEARRQVICFTTDGSFAMSCGELETLARLRLPVRIVHLTNGSLGWIKMLQHLYFAGRYHGVEGSAADAVQVAKGFGVPAARATSVGELRALLKRHRAVDGPTLIDVHVPDQTVEVPPVASWQAALDGSTERPVY